MSGKDEKKSAASGLPEDKLPFAPDAERSLLGAIMLEPQIMTSVSDQCTQEDFFRESHARIFEAMTKLAEDSQSADATSVIEYLRATGTLEHIGGETFLLGLLDHAAPSGVAEQYAKLIRDRAQSRTLIRTAHEIVQSGLSGEYPNSEDYVQFAEARLLEVMRNSAKGNLLNIKDVLEETVAHIESLCAQENSITGLASGFRDLDKMTLGLHGGELIILAARPAMGKSALALNLAAHAAISGEKSVLLFSLEMSAEQLGMRLLSQESRVSLFGLRSGELEPQDWDAMFETMKTLKQTNIFMDTTPGLTVSDIRARARRLKMEGRCDLIVVDYLQLVQPRPGVSSREQAVAEISRSLKQIALELDIPVISLSQLNRAVESRNDKRPMMGDLRESGAIEQDADIILFLYRDEVYNPNTERKGETELILAKQRNGQTGTVFLKFCPTITRFDNRDSTYLEADMGTTIGGLPAEDGGIPAPPPAVEAPFGEDDYPDFVV